MASLKNVVAFNRDKELMKLSVDIDEVMLTTKEELQDFLVTYLEKEMDKLTSSISVSSKKKLVKMIDEKLARFEGKILNHVEEKMEKVTERIITKILSSEMEAEIKRRVLAKLEEIKQKL
jgi:hypothetical protein